MTFFTRLLAALLGVGLVPAAAWAQDMAALVRVEGAWARASVPGQHSSGVFMRLTARGTALRLVGVSTPAAGTAELHEMKMEGDVMKMRAVDSLELPADKPVELKPGSLHVMLMALKAPLLKGASVPLTLHFKDAQSANSQIVVQALVTASAPSPAVTPMNREAHGH